LKLIFSDGTIGQANYSTAKAAISGLTRTLAIEGAKANIKTNCLAPRAGTAMTMTVWPKEMIEAMSVGWIIPRRDQAHNTSPTSLLPS
jgi:multifunctional beta-oxidation protein